MKIRLLLLGGALSALALAMPSIASPGVTAPPGIAKAGKIVFCSDLGYPPMESLSGSRPVGADIDIGAGIGRLMGVRAEFKNVGFDGLIAALLAKKCDAIISGMTDTSERRAQVDFTDYLDVGMSLMVRKGNPHNITGLASLSGRTVAVQVGTTERDALIAENRLLSKQHRKPVAIKLFQKDADAAAALDAYFSDDPPVGYYVKLSGGRVEVAADKIQAAPFGIATRKNDVLGVAVGKSVSALYATGTMKSILARWGLSAFASGT